MTVSDIIAVLIGLIGLIGRAVLVWVLAWAAFFLLREVFKGSFLGLKPLYQRLISVGISFAGCFGIFAEPVEVGGIQPWVFETVLAFFAFVPEIYGDPNSITPSTVTGVIRGALDEASKLFPRGSDTETSAEPSKPRSLDTHRFITITPAQAARGCKVRVKTETGTKISLNIPKNTRSGRKLRVTGEGKKMGDRVGDLYVAVNVDSTKDGN
jgi:hypothetical protein